MIVGDKNIPLMTTCLERDILSTGEVAIGAKLPAEIYRGKVTEWKITEGASFHFILRCRESRAG